MTSSLRPGSEFGIFPTPRVISQVEGLNELSADVRLATSDVLPFIRKTIRSTLSSVGVRVVANKKQFVVSINITSVDDLKLDDVPASGRDNYYELNLINNMIEIKAHSQFGALWGAQTFAQIFRTFGHGRTIPNLRIRDWSEMNWRGLFFKMSWGMDLMTPDLWGGLMDRMLRNKLNIFGFELCGTVFDPVNGKPIDILLVPASEDQTLATEIELQWYSAENDKWHQEKGLPRIFAEDLFRYIAAGAREKGLCFVPGLNLSAFSRIAAGKAEDVKSYSLDDTSFRDVIRAYCERLSDDCLQGNKVPMTLDFSAGEMKNEMGALQRGIEGSRSEFLVWFLQTVAADRFEEVVIEGESVFGTDGEGAVEFLNRLKELQLDDHLRIEWRRAEEGQSVLKNVDGNQNSLSVKGQWLAPDITVQSRSGYDSRLELIDEACRNDGESLFEGILLRGVIDSAYLDHIHYLAQLSWNPDMRENLRQEVLASVSRLYGDAADNYLQGMEQLQKAASSKTLELCFYGFGMSLEGALEEYPEAALRRLADGNTKEAIEELNESADSATQAIGLLRPLAETEKEILDDYLIKTAGSLTAEAARLEGMARCFAVLLEKSKIIKAKVSVPDEAKKEARKPLLSAIQTIETHKPSPLAPSMLAGFTPLLKFLAE